MAQIVEYLGDIEHNFEIAVQSHDSSNQMESNTCKTQI